MPFNLYTRSSNPPEPTRPSFRIPRVRLATSPTHRAEICNGGSAPYVPNAPRPLLFQTVANTSDSPGLAGGAPPPVPPRLHPPTFVTIVKKFPNYVGVWEPDPNDEVWDEEEMHYFDARFGWEERQIAGEDAGKPPEPPAKWSLPLLVTPE